MPRSRMIKPEFWNDEKLSKVSRESRLIFIGMWTSSDDFGITKGNPAWLKSQIFPYDDDIKIDQFKKWLIELEHIHTIIPFIVNDEKYYFIRTFTRHQKIDKPSKTRNPDPPQNIITVASVSENSSETVASVSENSSETVASVSENSSETVASVSEMSIDETETETETETEEKQKRKGNKKSTPIEKNLFLEFVLLSPGEFSSLIKNYGENSVNYYIEQLNNYIGKLGKDKYESHYYVIRSWIANDKKKDKIIKNNINSQDNKNHDDELLKKLEDRFDGKK